MKIQEGTWERSREKELIILTGPRETVTGGKRRPQAERSPRERPQPNRWGGEREREDGSVGQCLYWSSRESTQHRVKDGISLEGLNALRSQEGRARRATGGSGQLSHWCPWSLWWGVHTLSVGMFRQQENMKF